MNVSTVPGALGEPDDIFEIEVVDLRHPHDPARALRIARAGSVRWSLSAAGLSHSPLTPGVARWMRVRRLVMATLLVLLVLPGLFPKLSGRVLIALALASGTSMASGLSTAHYDSLAPLLEDARWSALEQRPFEAAALAPGAVCPATPGHDFTAGVDAGLGVGPAYAVAPGSDAGALELLPPHALGARGQGWAGQKVVWFVDAAYQGPVLIRGRRLDGPGQIRFNGGLDQVAEIANLPAAPLLPALRLEGDSSLGAPWPGWPSYSRMRAPGCYAYQVDGVNFTEVIVFQARGGACGGCALAFSQPRG